MIGSSDPLSDACVPVLYPGNQQEVIDLGVHAFRLSRYCGAWVGLKVVTAVSDGIGSVDLGLDRHAAASDPEAVVAGRPWRHEPLATIGESLALPPFLEPQRAAIERGLKPLS